MSRADGPPDDALVRAAAGGDDAAWRELVARFDDRLRRMVRLRLNPRLRGRVDEEDVLQEAYLAVHQMLPRYAAAPQLPPFVWVRAVAGLKLAEAHRRHLGTLARDAGQEVHLAGGDADPAALADVLVGVLTSPSQAAAKAELRARVHAALARLAPDDREVLALRHFEQLSTAEAAAVLGLSKAGAGKRYLTALTRIRGLFEQPGAG